MYYSDCEKRICDVAEAALRPTFIEVQIGILSLPLKRAGCVHIQMHRQQEKEEQQHMLHTRAEETLQSNHSYSYSHQLQPRPFVVYYIRS